MEMTVSTVHPHFHRWIFLKTILHDVKKVRVLWITKELATFVFCMQQQQTMSNSGSVIRRGKGKEN